MKAVRPWRIREDEHITYLKTAPFSTFFGAVLFYIKIVNQNRYFARYIKRVKWQKITPYNS